MMIKNFKLIGDGDDLFIMQDDSCIKLINPMLRNFNIIMEPIDVGVRGMQMRVPGQTSIDIDLTADGFEQIEAKDINQVLNKTKVMSETIRSDKRLKRHIDI